MTGHDRPSEYRDFTVRLVRTDGSGTGVGQNDAAWVRFDVHGVEHDIWERGRSVSVTKARQLAEGNAPVASKDSSIARDMGRVLLPGAVGKLFRAALANTGQGRDGVRLCIETDDPELAAVPWEISCVDVNGRGAVEDREFLFRHPALSVVRRPVPGARPSRAEPSSDPVDTVILCTALDVSDPHERLGLPVRSANAPKHLSRQSLEDVARRLDALRYEVVVPADPVTYDGLCDELGSPASVFCFGGHGTTEGIVVAGADGREAPTPIPPDDLARILREAGVQIALLAACHTATEQGVSREGTHNGWNSVAGALVDGGVPWVIGVRGPVADSVAADLTREFLLGLAAQDSVENALAHARVRITTGGWLPVLYTSVYMPDVRLRPRAPVVGAPGLRAFPVQGEADVSEPLAWDDRPCRLDVLWGLDRGPVRGVLADRPGTDLVRELQDVECGPLRAVTRPPKRSAAVGEQTASKEEALVRREWYGVRCDGGEVPRSVGSLALMVSRRYDWTRHLKHDPDGSSLGFVVSHRVAGPGAGAEYRGGNGWAAADARAAVDLVRAIGALLRGAAVVLHVTGADEEAVLRAAEEAGGLLRPPPDSSAVLPAVLTRVGRGDTDRRSTAPGTQDSRPSGSGDPPPSDDLFDQMLEREEQAELGEPEDPREVHARERLRKLAAKQKEPRDEARLLVGYFRDGPRADVEALLRVLARDDRDGAARYASLAAAAFRDDHLDIWLEAAEGLPTASGGPAEGTMPIEPLRLPLDLFPESVRTRVALGLLRRDPDPARAVPHPDWDSRVTSDLSTVLRYLRSAPGDRDSDIRNEADLRFLLRLDAHTAAATALRVGVGSAIRIDQLTRAGELAPAGWAALSARPLEEASVRLLLDEAEWRRRAIGFHQERAEHEGDLLSSAEDLRALFVPSPPFAPAPT
ncbi:CHAT domain-containing protein [Streptomyces phaeochromogenes]|uniref:CHAT domain-containing protein n=1 Tax=Streptomyces phaeochromogenes TaxID=1923 RepID=UPI00386FD0CA|nr:CHAT domain-containing protein [Streptomyces phaeochromogenes]